MAKHRLYRHFEDTSPLASGAAKEGSPAGDGRASTSDAVALVRRSVLRSGEKGKSGSEERVTSEKTNLNLCEALPAGNCDSDSDSDEFFGNSRSGAKLPYSAREDEFILKFVLKGQNVFKVGSISLWRHLESKKDNPKRTYQSLKNRFLRCIRPHIFTRYGHLITSSADVEKILAKFPELKCKVGRTNTLSRLQLPTRLPIHVSASLAKLTAQKPQKMSFTFTLSKRSPNSKSSEGVSAARARDEEERAAALPSCSSRREYISNLHNLHRFERKVTIRDKSLAVSVNFSSKEQLHKLVIPPARIYETFKKFKKKNKLILCSACGRYNLPKKNKLPDSSGHEKDLHVGAKRRDLGADPSAADPGAPSPTAPRSPPPHTASPGEWQIRPYSPFSPRRGAAFGWGTAGGSDEEAPGRVEGAPGSGERPLGSDEGALGSVDGARGREPDSAAAELLRETDDEMDSTYDVTMTDFKKLIKNEEERLLVKRCLYGKAGMLGLSDSISQMSMESYFVELSPNLATPELTIDYSSRSPTHNGERDSSSSLLARNMMKMLEEKRKAVGES